MKSKRKTFIFLHLVINGKCAKNHEGPLCFKCMKGYVKLIKSGLCEVCDNNLVFYVKLIIVFIFIIVYIMVQMRFNFRSSISGNSGILLKQILTHFQQISIIAVTDLGWTAYFQSYFAFQSYISFFSDEPFPFDCILVGIKGDSFIKTVTVTILLPLIFSLIFSFCLMIEQAVYFIRSKGFSLSSIIKDLKVSLILIIYLLMPEITRKCFSLMNCIELDESKQLRALKFSPDIVCWSKTHQDYILSVALPGLLAWTIFYPVFLFFIMFRNRSAIKKIILVSPMRNVGNKFNKNLINEEDHSKTSTVISRDTSGLTIKKKTSKKTKLSTDEVDLTIKKNSKSTRLTLISDEQIAELNMIMSFIHKGYHEDYYYWEIVNFAKKIALIFIASFTDFFPKESKATVLLALLSIFLFLQVRIKPYINEPLNNIEFLSLLVTFLSANIGVLLFTENFKKISNFFLTLMISINAAFVIYWIVVFIRLRAASAKEAENKNQTPEQKTPLNII